MHKVGPYSFTDTDTARTFGNLGPWWRLLTSNLEVPIVTAIGERIADDVAAALGAPRSAGPTLANELGALGYQAQGQLSRAEPATTANLLASVWQSLHDASAALRASGAISTTGSGTVAQLNVSGGGVPKRPVDRVTVSWKGLEGDRQKYRLHHGRPWQALCLWSGEVIDEFAADGHPIAPSAAGENVTIRGLDWSTVRTGVRFRIGAVLAEASLWALPCKTNARWFLGGDFGVMHHDRGPVSRMYATVIEPGEIAAGDAVHLVA